MSEHSNALSRRAFLGAAMATGAAAIISTTPMKALGVTAAEKQAQADAALGQLNAMESKLEAASTDFVNAEAEQLEAQNKMDEAQGRIDEASGRITDLQEQLGTRARSMYRTGSLSFIDLLMGATSFQAFTNNWDLLNDMNESDAEMVEETKTLRTEVQEQKEVYAQQEAVAAEKKEQAATAQAEAQTLVNQMQSTYDSLSAEAQQLYNQEQEARAAAAEATVSPVVRNNGGGSDKKKPSGSSGSSSKPQGGYGSGAVSRARSQLGVPYKYGAGTPDVAWDCSHLVCWACGISYMRADTIGSTFPVAADPKPGDICYRKGHVGVYIGGGEMIHAPQTGDVVKISGIGSCKILRY